MALFCAFSHKLKAREIYLFFKSYAFALQKHSFEAAKAILLEAKSIAFRNQGK